MAEFIQWKVNSMKQKQELGSATALFSREAIHTVKKFHNSFPQYSPTPLHSLPNLAEKLGVAGIYIKDESWRFGLNAFKVLGGSYAIARHMAEQLQRNINELPFAVLTSSQVKQQLGNITFATTTDGNHGRGIAWTARQLGQRSVVYMPKGSSPYRLQAIRNEGAEASITDFNYDDTVRMTAAAARKHGWVMVQDTAWEGYQDIPAWIMQGYGTLAAEALEQLNAVNIQKPSHVFVQAGVGSLAGAVQGYFTDLFQNERPHMTIVESNQADCFYQSVLAADGKARKVGGDMATIMAGLACGEPNLIGWNLLRDYSDSFAACFAELVLIL
ncbi:PLP-dependent lyase/thiolase [Sporomusaceae bacterium FL31]|nr:PLP-dependent lyase/thiolase [Sporomusaceae bacterium]